MKITHPAANFRDERGEIVDILVKEEVQFVTMITSAKGSTRGNHYHKSTTQWTYVLQGKIKLLSQLPDGPVTAAVMETGDLSMTPPFERHAITALEDSVIMVFTRGVRGGADYEKDTFRLAEPLADAATA